MVSNIFYFHPYLGKWSNLTNIFQMGWNHQPDMLIPYNPTLANQGQPQWQAILKTNDVIWMGSFSMPLKAELNKRCASCLAPGFVCMKSQTFGSKPFSVRGKRSLWVVPLQPWNLGVLAPPQKKNTYPKYQTSAGIYWHQRGTISTFKVLFDKNKFENSDTHLKQNKTQPT